ncbi:MAG: hypothetical protein KQA34_03100 [Candidatus Aenigmarchaeota archaeon]|nr:hypothetical protein [Candidatus Aenigmarchaeota archaeon]
MGKYRIHNAKIYLNEKAIMKLLNVNRLDSVVYDLDIELRRKEFKNIRDNCVIYKKDGEIYFAPLSYFIVDGLDGINVNYYREELEKVLGELIKWKNRIGKIEKYERISELIGIKEIGVERHFRFAVGFGLFMENLKRFVNEFVIENERIPSNKEMKEYIINKLEYNIKEEIEEYVDKLKILIIK